MVTETHKHVFHLVVTMSGQRLSENGSAVATITEDAGDDHDDDSNDDGQYCYGYKDDDSVTQPCSVLLMRQLSLQIPVYTDSCG